MDSKVNFKDPYLMQFALVAYTKAIDGKKPKVIKKEKKMEYFDDKKVTKGHFLDIYV